MPLKSIGMMFVGLIVVIMVCVKQTFAASPHSISSVETIIPTSITLTSYYNWSFEGEDSGDELGWSVSGAGDLNGDGVEDILIGAPMSQRDTPDSVDNEGVTFAFYGGSQGLSSTPDWMMGSGFQGYRFGSAVSGAGDVNGDGFDDVIIGAEDYKVDFGLSNQPKSGAVFVYSGSAGGLSETPAWTVLAEAKEIDLGSAVSDAGDVNGDGYDDVIVGAPYYESEAGQDNEGKVYLYLGSPGGLNTTPDWTYECGQATASCGLALGSAGDVNGDGYDDVIVGAPHFDGSFNQEGAAFLFHGSPEGLSAAPDWTIQGHQAGGEVGSSVAGAGDLNGDGFDDVILGAPFYPYGSELNVGAAFVYYGSTTGLSLVPDWETYGTEPASMYGASVHGAGDIDQDGYGDVIIGAYLFGIYGSTENQPHEGASYLYKGSPTGLGTLPNWMSSGDKAEAWFGYSVGAAGDVNGDDMDDVIVGAPMYRMDQRIILGSARVYYAQKAAPEYFIFFPIISGQDGE
jgi:hypothetical protein